MSLESTQEVFLDLGAMEKMREFGRRKEFWDEKFKKGELDCKKQ